MIEIGKSEEIENVGLYKITLNICCSMGEDYNGGTIYESCREYIYLKAEEIEEYLDKIILMCDSGIEFCRTDQENPFILQFIENFKIYSEQFYLEDFSIAYINEHGAPLSCSYSLRPEMQNIKNMFENLTGNSSYPQRIIESNKLFNAYIEKIEMHYALDKSLAVEPTFKI